MGLDMYLVKKNYVGAKYEHRKVKGEVEIEVEGRLLDIDFKKITYIIEEVGYWRKANAIHGWFVANVQGGKDDCGEYYVSYEKLQELKNLCMKAYECPNPVSILPPTAGFFFGSDKVDGYYYDDLKHTIDVLSGLDKNGEYYYQSSW